MLIRMMSAAIHPQDVSPESNASNAEDVRYPANASIASATRAPHTAITATLRVACVNLAPA